MKNNSKARRVERQHTALVRRTNDMHHWATVDSDEVPGVNVIDKLKVATDDVANLNRKGIK